MKKGKIRHVSECNDVDGQVMNDTLSESSISMYIVPCTYSDRASAAMG